MIDEERIATVCRQIAEKFHPDKIILFDEIPPLGVQVCSD